MADDNRSEDAVQFHDAHPILFGATMALLRAKGRCGTGCSTVDGSEDRGAGRSWLNRVDANGQGS